VSESLKMEAVVKAVGLSGYNLESEDGINALKADLDWLQQTRKTSETRAKVLGASFLMFISLAIGGLGTWVANNVNFTFIDKGPGQ
jgi:hypothetical protein